MCFIQFANRFLNKVLNGIKTFYSVQNLVEKPVGEQDKTHEFSPNVFIGLRKADCTYDIRCDDLIFNFIEEIRPEHLIYEWVIF